MAQEPDPKKALPDAKGDNASPAPSTWTFLENEAEKLGLIARNPAIGAAVPLAAPFVVIKRQ
jgi:hypothetical protein